MAKREKETAKRGQKGLGGLLITAQLLKIIGNPVRRRVWQYSCGYQGFCWKSLGMLILGIILLGLERARIFFRHQ